MSNTTTAQVTPAVEVEVTEDGTYVFVDGEFAGSVWPAYCLGEREAKVYGWGIRDERDGATTVNYGVMSSRRIVAEQKLATVLGLAGNYMRCDYPTTGA